MRFRRLILGAAGIIFVCFGLSADSLRWLSKEFDFGTIREEAGKAPGKVQFVNEGTEPTLIQRVKSTCGCTGVRYSQDLIEPGDTATVWFDYNPTGRPGRFEKHIKVYTGEGSDLTTITIRGTVIGAPQSLNTKYPMVYGPLRLSSEKIPMGETLYGTSRHEYIYGYNQGSDTLQLSWGEVPRYLSLGASSLKVAPGDLFTLSVYMNTRDGAEPGTMNVPVELYASAGGERVKATLHVTAVVKPDYSSLSGKDLRDAPAANVYPTSLDLGRLDPDSGKAIKLEFNVSNEGDTPLLIRRVHCPEAQQAVKVKSIPKTLKGKARGKVKFEVYPRELPRGDFKIGVELVSNDPLHPVRTVYLVGTMQ